MSRCLRDELPTLEKAQTLFVSNVKQLYSNSKKTWKFFFYVSCLSINVDLR